MSIKEKLLSSKFGKVALGSSVVSSALIIGSNAFASTTSTDVTAALTTTAGEVTKTLGGVAPIGLGIAGTFLAWRYGMKFFKSLSK